MPYTKTILCLANSYKTSGRCLAGVERLADGSIAWVRPVSAREHGEVSEQERMFDNGQDPRVGDVIEMPLLRRSPHAYQAENHLLDPRAHWRFVRRATWEEILSIVDRTGRPSGETVPPAVTARMIVFAKSWPSRRRARFGWSRFKIWRSGSNLSSRGMEPSAS